MDIIYFIIFAIMIIFMYYLINVIKDLQLQVSNIKNVCNNNSSSITQDNNNLNSETIDIKMKKDFVYLLDYIKNYFI